MNRVVYFEIHSPDVQRVMRFYEQVLGWKFGKSDIGPEDYWTITTGDPGSMGINGGLMSSKDGQPRAVNTVHVRDIDETVAKVTSAGGKVVLPRFNIPKVGDIAYCTDPDGIIFGIWQPEPGMM